MSVRRERPTWQPSSEELVAESLGEFAAFVTGKSPGAWMFRGQTQRSEPLLPLLLREGILPADADADDFERELLEQFRREAWPHVEGAAAQLGDWEWLAIAQHHGLPTRLLDWTRNAGAALFFSVEDPARDEDGVVYCYRGSATAELPREPSALRMIGIYHPPHVAGRFVSQRGCFTAHPTTFAEDPAWEGELVPIVIPRDRRGEIRDQLRTLGIDRALLFPGLDGIARSIRARCGVVADQ